MLKLAALLGIPTATAMTIVNIILNAGTLATVLIALATVLSSGATSILLLGWSTIKAEVIRRVALYGTLNAAIY
ncbi:uberolysin/carnocyclin family circular bacteriocin [Anaerobranca gottschalkii]|uniref:Circular bacteriocin, circularin A/uberolysin family n=1 Tax=Anaerobranca gottschalkii DSM 13577 TaxID=1120990 RepID=A0A1I0CIZ2_9FIRM|nr:uberolysin/carnocyclin family circular bacteriocin [Anaerobranca gottschalkii]SET19122.1 circular bacteriocin, circularin A/uberolysin family [Anaerobranca gottschalkii DSM 13577]